MESTSIPIRLRNAVQRFWRTRSRQSRNQGVGTGDRDRGARSAVTGGAHLDGFADLVQGLVVDAGIPETSVFRRQRTELPGFYRAEKKWDVVIVVEGRLLATIEFKAQVGPAFGNNHNNRAEEALGNATDHWAAFREGAFSGAPRPWLGYLMLLEDAPGSAKPISVSQPHFPVFEEFRNASYAKRYEVLLTRMMRDRLYDATCLLLSPSTASRDGTFTEPCPDLSFSCFAESLLARAMAYRMTRP